MILNSIDILTWFNGYIQTLINKNGRYKYDKKHFEYWRWPIFVTSRRSKIWISNAIGFQSKLGKTDATPKQMKSVKRCKYYHKWPNDLNKRMFSVTIATFLHDHTNSRCERKNSIIYITSNLRIIGKIRYLIFFHRKATIKNSKLF